MTRWVHTVNGLPFSSVTDVRDCPLPLQVHPHAVTFTCHAAWTCSRTPSVPLAAGYSGWRSTSDALDSASAIELSPVLGADSGLFFCPGSYRSYEGSHCGVMCAVGSPREQGLLWGLPQLSMNRCMLPPASFTFQQGGFLETKRSQAI